MSLATCFARSSSDLDEEFPVSCVLPPAYVYPPLLSLGASYALNHLDPSID